jgi:hypothetical protein
MRLSRSLSWAETAVLLILSTTTVLAEDEVYGTACQSAVGTFRFGGCKPMKKGRVTSCYCKLDAYTDSVYACIDHYVPESHREEASAVLAKSCSWTKEETANHLSASMQVNATEPSGNSTVKSAFLVSHNTYLANYNFTYGRAHADWGCIAYG